METQKQKMKNKYRARKQEKYKYIKKKTDLKKLKNIKKMVSFMFGEFSKNAYYWSIKRTKNRSNQKRKKRTKTIKNQLTKCLECEPTIICSW